MKPHSSWRSDLQGLQTNIISYIYITSINFTKSPRPVFLATWEPVGDHRRLNEPGAEKTVSQHRTGTGQRATWTGGKKGKDKGKGKGKRRLVPDLCATCGLVPEKGGGRTWSHAVRKRRKPVARVWVVGPGEGWDQCRCHCAGVSSVGKTAPGRRLVLFFLQARETIR